MRGLEAVHWALHSRFMLGDTGYSAEQRAAFTPVRWPLVHTDPRSGRRVLFVGAHACEVPGLTLPEGRMLLLDLLEQIAIGCRNPPHINRDRGCSAQALDAPLLKYTQELGLLLGL